MRLASRTLIIVAGLTALSVVLGAQSAPTASRVETRLQLGNLLLDDLRYWEAIRVFEDAQEGATHEQRVRSSAGLLRALLPVAEFTRAQMEAQVLREIAPSDPDITALIGDALWGGGLFDEAEQLYRDALAMDPGSGAARHGVARSLTTRQRYGEALDWVQAALEAMPDSAAAYHTLGYIHRRMRRFGDAADAYERYAELLPTWADTEKADWARAEVQFLRSFGDRPAVELLTPRGLHTIPFRLVDEKVIVQGRVNGGDIVDFVMDTGAEQTVLSQRTAQQLGIRPISTILTAGVGEIGFRGLQAARLESIEFGSLGIRNLPVLIKNPPLGGLPTPEAEAFSPLAVGLSMIVDYARREIIIGEELPEEPFEVSMPLRQHRLAVVRGVVNGQIPRSFVVDTGGEVISISRGTANLLPPLEVRRVPVNVYGTSGWDEQAYLRPGTSLAFDQLLVPNYSVVVLNLHRPSALLGFHIGGTVGHHFLRDYRVVLDLGRSEMRLTRL